MPDYSEAIRILRDNKHIPDLDKAIALLEEQQPGYLCTVKVVGDRLHIEPTRPKDFMVKSIRLGHDGEGTFIIERAHSGGMDSFQTTWADLVEDVRRTLEIAAYYEGEKMP